MRWLHFILSHSIFIALCALALCYQTITLLQIPHNCFVYGLLFFSTLGSYNFYWLLSRYSFSKQRSPRLFFQQNLTYIILGGVSCIGMLYSLYFLPGMMPYVLLAVGLTLLYSLPLWPVRWAGRLRKAGVFKTTLLALTWSYVTVVIPAAQAVHASSAQLTALLIARFFFIGMLCAIFDRRDEVIDKIRGLHSLATVAGKRSLSIIMLFSFLIYMLSGIYVRMHFSNDAQLLAFFITGVVVAFVYKLSLKKQGYLFYYFVVDGLMLFSAAATFVASLC